LFHQRRDVAGDFISHRMAPDACDFPDNFVVLLVISRKSIWVPLEQLPGGAFHVVGANSTHLISPQIYRQELNKEYLVKRYGAMGARGLACSALDAVAWASDDDFLALHLKHVRRADRDAFSSTLALFQIYFRWQSYTSLTFFKWVI